MAMIEVKKEVMRYGSLIQRMSNNTRLLLTERDKREVARLIEKIRTHEEITDRIEQEVAEYLAKISESEISDEASLQIRGMLSIVGDLERMGDIYYQMSKTIERKIEEKIWFTPGQRENIIQMFETVDEALTIMVNNLEMDYRDVRMTDAYQQEVNINSFRKKLRKEHFKKVERGNYSFKSATTYSNLFNSLEKIGDHAVNVTEAIVGEYTDVDEENELD